MAKVKCYEINLVDVIPSRIDAIQNFIEFFREIKKVILTLFIWKYDRLSQNQVTRTRLD